MLAAFAWLALASSAQANNFGSNYVTDSSCGCTLHGTRSDIHYPDTQAWSVTGDNFGVMRVSAEHADSSTIAGLIQAGGNISNASINDDCAYSTGGDVVGYNEFKRYPSGDYICTTYNTITGTKSMRVQSTTSCGGNGTCWAAWVSGIKKADVDLNFGAAYLVLAGGEVRQADPGMTVKGTYGQLVADTPWQRTSNTYPNSTFWTTIGSASCQHSNSWRVESTPSPFQVQYLPSNAGCP